ncbi:chorismate mutase [Candidatus Bathyarchaeota archaeon]|nr:MAG: chorismate mutase [Candidatus Bathyarchaeota archaeon]
MEKISPLRKRIDEIDEQILRFLKERIDICENIGAIKREHGLPVKDVEREKEQYMRIAKLASKLGLDPKEVRAVYQEIIAMSIRAQERESYRS